MKDKEMKGVRGEEEGRKGVRGRGRERGWRNVEALDRPRRDDRRD